MVKLMLKITDFEEGKTQLNYEPNKMWDEDIINTSSRIHYEVDGCKGASFVKSDNVEDAVEEIIPKIILNEFFEYDYKFKDLGLPNPEYETYDDGNGFIEDVVEFLNLRNGDLYLIREEDVVDSLIEKGRDVFEVVCV